MRIAVRVVCALVLPLTFAAPAAGRPLSCAPGPFIVFFASNSAVLDKEAREILDYAIKQKDDCGPADAMIAGHTDTSEPTAISRKRAVAVSNYLRVGGFSRKIAVMAFGSTKLRVDTPPATPERQNRRVEITYGPPS